MVANLTTRLGQLTSSPAGGPYTGANKIINGDMAIDQRNAGASVTPTAGQFVVDRFNSGLSQTGKYSGQQNAAAVTPPAGFTNYLGITSASSYSVLAGGYFFQRQTIEGLNCTDFNWGTANAKAVTLSFWVRSSLTGTFGGALFNSASNRSYPFTYSIPVASTWTYITVAVPGDTSGTWLTTNGAGVQVAWGLGVGTTYSGTAGAWAGTLYISATGAVSVVGTNAATWYITGVKLEVGSIATPFVMDDYEVSLDKCKRYFQKVGQQTNNQFIVPSGFVSSTTRAFFNVQHGPVFRATPTFAYVGTVGNFNEGVSATALTALTANLLAPDVSNIFGDVASGLTAKNAATLQAVGTANYITFDAEL